MSRAIVSLLRTRQFIVVILLLCLCCQAKDKKPDVSGLVGSIVNWGENLNTPGATAEMRSVHKEFKAGLHYSTYDVYVSGVPRDQSYAVFQWPISKSGPSVVQAEIYIAADGRLCRREDECLDDSGPYIRLDFVSARGEPHRILMISKDGKYKVAAMVIPNPIVAHDQECRVEVVRGTPKFEVAIVRGEGFSSEEEIKYKSNSSGEILNKKLKTDGNGKFVLALAPNVIGKDQGDDELFFKAARCSPVVSYHWGAIDY